jgi:hypothetical protein
LRQAAKSPLALVVGRALTLTLGCLGLIWGVFALPRSEAADDFREIESRLLRSETLNRTISTQTLEGAAAQSLSACDTHSQRAMLLIQMPLAEAALQAGFTQEFDRHIRSLETRSRLILSCTPRDSFVWLLVFNLEALHGLLNQRYFDALAMSYETSPNEAWISIRRTLVAMPQLLIAPEPLRQKIISEFQQLITNGFVDSAARSYLAAGQPIRSQLLPYLEQLNPPQQKSFSDALQKLRP